MNKAFFLFLVFAWPGLALYAEMNVFYMIWFWVYVVLAVIYATCVWHQPDHRMIWLVLLAPVFYYLFFFVAVFCIYYLDRGPLGSLMLSYYFFLTTLMATWHFALFFVAIAFSLHYMLKKVELLPKSV